MKNLKTSLVIFFSVTLLSSQQSKNLTKTNLTFLFLFILILFYFIFIFQFVYFVNIYEKQLKHKCNFTLRLKNVACVLPNEVITFFVCKNVFETFHYRKPTQGRNNHCKVACVLPHDLSCKSQDLSINFNLHIQKIIKNNLNIII